MIKRMISIIFVVLIALLSTNFFSFFDNLKSNFNIFLIFVIYATLFYGLSQGLLFALIGGFIFELYSVFNFGLIIIALVLSLGFIFYLFNNFLTNRSLGTLIILTIAGTMTYNLSLAIFSNLLDLFGFTDFSLTFNLQFLYSFFWQIFLHTLIISLIFIVSQYISRKMKHNFFIKQDF